MTPRRGAKGGTDLVASAGSASERARRGLATLAIRLPEQAHRQLDLSLGQRLALQWLIGLRAGQTEHPGSVVAHGKY
jgi:hypothetical protein